MRATALLATVLLLALATPAPGQHAEPAPGVLGLAAELEDMLWQLDACDVELRSTIVWRVRSWGERGKAALRAMEPLEEESGRALRAALLAAPPLPTGEDPLDPGELERALARPIPREPLEEARAYLRFTAALERAGAVEALGRLRPVAPDHPWVVAVDATLARAASIAPVVSWVDALSDVLGEPGTVAGCERWLLEPADDHDTLDPSSPGHRAGGVVRAAWLLRQDRPLLAGRLVRMVELARGLSHGDEVVPGALDVLAAIAWQDAVEALGQGAARARVATNLSRVVDMSREAASLSPRARERAVLLRFHEDARRLRDHLLAQAEEDRTRPPPPSWDEWRRTPPEARLPLLLAHLRDQAGKQVMEPGGADPLFDSPPFPPDSPERRSVAHELIALGDLAVPALIELLIDDRPTRTVQFGRSFAAQSWEVLPLARVAGRALNALWGEDVLRPSSTDDLARRREMQAQARAWLARWGTLARWHEQRAQEADVGWVRSRHAQALLRVAPDRARALIPRVYETIEDDPELLRAVGEAADPAFAPLLRAELGSTRDHRVVEAALGLLRLHDPLGLATLHELARRSPGSMDIEVIERIAAAGAPHDAGRILLEVTDRAAWFDWRTAMMDPAELPRADVVLALARIVARRDGGEVRAITLQTLSDLVHAAGTDDERLLAALLSVDAEVSADPARRRHGAATLLALGVEAVARFEASTSPRVRRELFAALAADDAVRRATFVEALSQAGPAAFTWAAADLATDAPERDLLARTRVDASSWVHDDVTWPTDTHTVTVPMWLHRRWAPDLLAEVITEWERAERPEALVVTVERAPDLRGVSAHAVLSRHPYGPGLHAHVRAPGLTLDGLVARDELTTFFAELTLALEREPDAPATIRLVVAR